MRKYIIAVALLVLGISTVHLFAQTYSFHQNDQVALKNGLSYAWIRERPSSECACVVVTINSTKQILRILESTPDSDGIQNWWRVTTTTGTIKQGWIEEQSLRLYKASSPATATLSSTQQPRQFAGAEVQIREGVYFIWLRGQPSSSSGVVSTVNFFHPTSRGQCLMLGTVPGTVKWDGRQWWRYINSSSNSSSGWVEENSLVDCNPHTSPVPTSGADAVATIPYGLTEVPTISTYAAYQIFENGMMIWRQDTQMVYTFINGSGYIMYSFDDYSALESPKDTPTAGRYTPVNAFGKVWNGLTYFSFPIRDKLGWATAPEQGYTAQITATNLVSVKNNTHTTISLPDGRLVGFNSLSYMSSWSFD